MKRTLISITIFLLAVLVLPAGNAHIEFVKATHDFGTIKEDGGPVECEFEFVNDGDEPLVIISANASCGCTRPEYPKKPIKPGKKAKIKVTYLPKGRPGEFTKSIKVRTNGKNPKNVTLKITGVVTPATD